MKPAPPRPRRLECLISSSVASGFAALNGGAQGSAGLQRVVEQDVGAADVVVDGEQLARPLRHRQFLQHQFGDLVEPFAAQARNRPAVRQQRRTLVAQAGAGGGVDRNQAVLGDMAALRPQFVAQVGEQILVAQHAVGDVVGEQQPVLAGRFGMQEAVEADDAFDAGARQV